MDEGPGCLIFIFIVGVFLAGYAVSEKSATQRAREEIQKEYESKYVPVSVLYQHKLVEYRITDDPNKSVLVWTKDGSPVEKNVAEENTPTNERAK